MKFHPFFKRDQRQQNSSSQDDTIDQSQEDQSSQKRRFNLFHSKKEQHQQQQQQQQQQRVGGKNDQANHNRTESNETSITHLSINESYSADGSLCIEDSDGSFEVLSPHHMIQYGKSLFELEAEGQLQGNKSDAENSSEEGLSCIMEENSGEAQSSDSSAGVSSQEVSPSPSPTATPLSLSQRDERSHISGSLLSSDNKKLPAVTKQRFSQINTIPPRRIQMDGSILSQTGGAWAGSSKPATKDSSSSSSEKEDEPVSFFDCISKKPVDEDQDPSGLDGLSPANLLDQEESSSSGSSSSSSSEGSSCRKGLLNAKKKKKKHRRSSRSFLNFFSRPAARSLTPAQDDNAPASVYELVASAFSDAGDDCADEDLNQRMENVRWTASDGTPRFQA